jgi:hypothetical protein
LISVRVSAFLSGLPNYGQGKLKVPKLVNESSAKEKQDLILPQTAFYKSMVRSKDSF